MNREENRNRCKEYYHLHRDTQIEKSQKYQRLHKEELKEKQKRRIQERKLIVLSHYSKGIARCACCGEKEIKFLCLDHIAGGGEEHRRQIGHGDIYFWVLKNNFPDGFQVLCHNCNFAKTAYGCCPHQREVGYETISIC